MSEPLLSINNMHALASGDPPIVTNSGGTYIGYFENGYGEQWLFTFDRTTGRGELRGGDIGWNEPVAVVDGMVGDLILASEESQWLAACWSAAAQRS